MSGTASNAIEPAETHGADMQKLSTLVEIGQALATLNLDEAVPRVLGILARHDGVVRSTLELHHPETGEVEVEATAGVATSRPRVRSISVPMILGGQTIGAVGVDLRSRANRDDPRPLRFLRVVGLMIAQAVRIDRLSGPTPRLGVKRGGGPIALGERLEEVEREALQDALRATRGNRARAARLLSTTERILNYRVRKYGIDCRRFKR